MLKKALTLLLLLSLLLSTLPCVSAATGGDLVVLYTNDVHCAVDAGSPEDTMGYAQLAALKKELEATHDHVVLVDAGDAIQGEAIGTLSDGSHLVDIMNYVGYDYAVFGNHEFDYGMDTALSLPERSQAKYLACNFTSLETGEAVTDAYHVQTYGDLKIGYVGICTPETFTKSSPVHFQDEDGNYIYSFAQGDEGLELYDAVQSSIDAALAEDADLIIAIGHLGTEAASAPWRSYDVIANTTGIDAFIDGHSHSVIQQELVQDKEGQDVILTSTGTKLQNIGVLTVSTDGTISTELVSGYTETDPDTEIYINDIQAQFEAQLEQVVGNADTALVIADPVTGQRLIRHRETNLGDFCADAYRAVCGAQIGMVNGGGIRAMIDEGPVTYGELIAVHPYGNMLCVVEASGQEILDTLEVAAMYAPLEHGSFLHVSGLKYTIDTTIPSTVTLDEYGMLESLGEHRRVKDVQVLQEDGSFSPLDPNATYTLASHDYMLKEDGCSVDFFKDDVFVMEDAILDNQALMQYLQEDLGGKISEGYADPYGQGRITILEAPVPEETIPEETLPGEDIPQTADHTFPLPLLLLCLLSLTVFLRKRT